MSTATARRIASVFNPGGMAGLGAYAPRSLTFERPPHISGAPYRVARARRQLRGMGDVSRTAAWGSGLGADVQPRRVTPAERERNRAAFVGWLRRTFPQLADKAAKLVNLPTPGGAQLGAETTSQPSTWEKLFDTISTLGQSVLTYRTQKELLDMQLDRARQGLPPLDSSQYAPTVRVTTDPATIQTALSTAGAGISSTLRPLLVPGLIAVGAWLLLGKKKRGRR